jgi:hypothetical protein
VLACLLVGSLVGFALIETSVLGHRQSRVLAQRQQCFWLAEAGVQRAVARLRKSPKYDGEKWVVPADVLEASHPGLVTVLVTKPSKPDTEATIRVEARFPDDPVRGTVYQRELSIKLPSPGGSP